MIGQYCPYCGNPVHEEVVIPPTATRYEDVWNLWFCDNCKWVSDWPGMPQLPGTLSQLGKPIRDPKEAKWRKEA